MNATGTTYEVTRIGAKTKRRHIYQIHRTTNGLYVARMMIFSDCYSEWSDPFDTEEDALKHAMHLRVTKNIRDKESKDEYYRSGGY